MRSPGTQHCKTWDTAYAHFLEKYPYPFALGKAARQSLSEFLAYPELKYGVTVNTVQPGIIEEMGLEEALALDEDPRIQQRSHASPTDVTVHSTPLHW